jgi:hypothetical protein
VHLSPDPRRVSNPFFSVIVHSFTQLFKRASQCESPLMTELCRTFLLLHPIMVVESACFHIYIEERKEYGGNEVTSWSKMGVKWI